MDWVFPVVVSVVEVGLGFLARWLIEWERDRPWWERGRSSLGRRAVRLTDWLFGLAAQTTPLFLATGLVALVMGWLMAWLGVLPVWLLVYLTYWFAVVMAGTAISLWLWDSRQCRRLGEVS